MPNLASVRDLTWSLFLEPSSPQRAAFARAIPGLAAEGEEPVEKFSVFNKRHLDRAMEIVAELMRRANEAPGEDGLFAAAGYFREIKERENPDLVDYAMMVFITHHPKGRALIHVIPLITLRNPELVAPSTVALEGTLPGPEMRGLAAEDDAEAVSSVFVGGALPTDRLEWFREDPFANEHHTHWHVVYPTVGVPNPANPSQPKFKERQGEMFFYMHQQMLARYDAERVALEISRVRPLEDYRKEIELGYDPGPFLKGQGYGMRPPATKLVDFPDYRIADHEDRRERVGKAVRALEFKEDDPQVHVPIDKIDLLGATVESNGTGIGPFTRRREVGDFYGDLHNVGHGMIAAVSQDFSGVMTTTETAIRDPVFWEWHKHIDDFYALWQDTKGKQSFSDRPSVRLRKQLDPEAGRAASPDLILAFEDQLPPEAGEDLQAWARNTFGGEHWNEDFGETDRTTGRLETTMLQRQLTLADRVTTVPLEHLIHRPFVYFFRAENQVDREVQVTVRVFLVPKSLAADRRAWIEMDKFVHRLEPLEKAVVARRGSQSSVVRKPAVMKPELFKGATARFSQEDLERMRSDGLPGPTADQMEQFIDRTVLLRAISNILGRQRYNRALPFLERHAEIVRSEQPRRPNQNDSVTDIERLEAFNYCTCGWPYNLLVPRGTKEGMPFRLAVICSDWEIDQVGGDESCGSLSFCGARDRYPDKRDMGYPFDRPFEVPVADTIMANPNMAFRDITIQRMPDVIEEPDGD